MNKIWNSVGIPGVKKLPVKKLPATQVMQEINSRVQKIPWRMAWQPIPGESHEWRSSVGYSPWGCKELDMTEVTEHALTHMKECIHYTYYV